MTQALSGVSCTSVTGELALLLIENESTQAESAKLQRAAARESVLNDAQQQVNALHQAADATMLGAVVGGSLSIAGGACQIVGAGFQYRAEAGKAAGDCADDVANNALEARIYGDIGEVSCKVADPAKALVGDSTAARFQAEAKRSETLAEQARWQAEDASGAIDRADKRRDKAIDLLEGIRQDDRASANAIIGRI